VGDIIGSIEQAFQMHALKVPLVRALNL